MTRLLLIFAAILSIYSCNNGTGPEEPDTTATPENPLIGSWVEIIDTTTEDGKQIYEERTKLGDDFWIDTVTYNKDSTVKNTINGLTVEYYVSGDTVCFPGHDTLKWVFNIEGDTLDENISDPDNILRLRIK